MALHAFKDGLTILNQANLNSLLALQPFIVIYEGTERDAKPGSGVLENSIASYSYAARFTLVGSTEIGRIILELDRDGTGADLTVQIRSGLTSSNDGTLLKEVLIPTEFIPTTAGWVSIPIGLTGLTSGGRYWIVVLKGGDSSNKLDWVGESSADANYPAYRRSGSTGSWTTGRPAMHFAVYSGVPGMPRHIIEGGAALTTVEYSSGLPSKIYQYIPPSDGPEGGVRDIITLTYSGGLPVKGE